MGRTAANTRPAALPRRTSTGTGTWTWTWLRPPPFDKISVLLNSGDGTFGSYETVSPTFAAGDHPHEITRTRMNAHSRPDRVVANGPTDKVSVLLNTTQ